MSNPKRREVLAHLLPKSQDVFDDTGGTTGMWLWVNFVIDVTRCWRGRGRRASQWIWLIPGSRWTGHEQKWTKNTSPKSTQTQSQRKRFIFPNGANRRASGAKTATTTTNGANRRASSGAKSATPTACATSAEMALGLRQTSHSVGHWRFLPPFFFCACSYTTFFNAPLWCTPLAPKFTFKVHFYSCFKVTPFQIPASKRICMNVEVWEMHRAVTWPGSMPRQLLSGIRSIEFHTRKIRIQSPINLLCMNL